MQNKEWAAALIDCLSRAERWVALTGAGVSTESGIPDFRSTDSGLWSQTNAMDVASIGGFLDDPMRFYKFWFTHLGALDSVESNMTHQVLVALERAGTLRAIVTQNIDGLHQKAGSKQVYEVHGSFRNVRCLACDYRCALAPVFQRVKVGDEPRCPRCGSWMKPDVVLFGEMLPEAFSEAQTLVSSCDGLLVLGTSLEVHPVAGLVPAAAAAGSTIVIVNRDPSPFDHLATLRIQAELGPLMSEVQSALRETKMPSSST